MSDAEEKGSEGATSLRVKVIRAVLVVVALLLVSYGILYAVFSMNATHAQNTYNTDRENCTANYEKQNQIALKAYWDGGTYSAPASCDKIPKEIKAGILGLPVYVTSTVQ